MVHQSNARPQHPTSSVQPLRLNHQTQNVKGKRKEILNQWEVIPMEFDRN